MIVHIMNSPLYLSPFSHSPSQCIFFVSCYDLPMPSSDATCKLSSGMQLPHYSAHLVDRSDRRPAAMPLLAVCAAAALAGVLVAAPARALLWTTAAPAPPLAQAPVALEARSAVQFPAAARIAPTASLAAAPVHAAREVQTWESSRPAPAPTAVPRPSPMAQSGAAMAFMAGALALVAAAVLRLRRPAERAGYQYAGVPARAVPAAPMFSVPAAPLVTRKATRLYATPSAEPEEQSVSDLASEPAAVETEKLQEGEVCGGLRGWSWVAINLLRLLLG